MESKKSLNNTKIVIEKNGFIHPSTVIYGTGTLILKNNALIEEGCTIGLGNGGEIVLGENSRVTRSVLEVNDYSIYHGSKIQNKRFYGTTKELNVGGKIIIGANCAVAPFSLILASLGGSIILADNVNIMSSSLEADGGTIIMGEYSYTNRYAVLNGMGNITIGKHVMIAPHVCMYSGNHNVVAEKELNIQGFSTKGIVIEDDVWVGAGVKVMDGVTLKKGSIIGAGAVVTKNTHSYGIHVGIPATMIKERPNKHPVKTLQSKTAGTKKAIPKNPKKD